MGEQRPVDEAGAILVEYGMILVAVVLVSFALIQIIGGQVLEMFRGALSAFG
jgi:Flp pilus assembly pilin Flp